jgi:hypothetical protein
MWDQWAFCLLMAMVIFGLLAVVWFGLCGDLDTLNEAAEAFVIGASCVFGLFMLASTAYLIFHSFTLAWIK